MNRILLSFSVFLSSMMLNYTFAESQTLKIAIINPYAPLPVIEKCYGAKLTTGSEEFWLAREQEKNDTHVMLIIKDTSNGSEISKMVRIPRSKLLVNREVNTGIINLSMDVSAITAIFKTKEVTADAALSPPQKPGAPKKP